MKTVPKDHQELGRDQLLTEPAPYVPLNQVLSSTSLRTTASSGQTKRLVNKDLRKNVRPPWEQQGRVEEWIKTAAPSAVRGKGGGGALNGFNSVTFLILVEQCDAMQ